ncbi:MAG: hypothetical protein J6N76_01345, partial [Lachnospiraceae bacterium]|nr:hypothetical protein [Lachnospiraceae bacterium]
MRAGEKRTIKYVAAVLALAVFIMSLPVVSLTARADGILNQKRYAPAKFRRYGITYGEFCQKNGEPASAHLLVGTYLINIVPSEEIDPNGDTAPGEAVSKTTYVAAMTSRETYQQKVIFYKSELANGEWRDLDTATELSHVMSGDGVRVSDEEMNDMLITAYISGGKTISMIDEGDGRSNPFNNPSPYNLDEMEPMSEILALYQGGTLASRDNALVDPEDVSANQSNRFIYDRLDNLFKHDEVTGTLPIEANDAAIAQTVFARLSANLGTDESKKTEAVFNDIEAAGKYPEDTDSDVMAAGRMIYHFSDTRNELTNKLDAQVNELWELYLEYKDAADAAENGTDDGFRDRVGISYNDASQAIYNLCAEIDAERRAEAYYNLALNEDFHGTGSVLMQLSYMIETGTSGVGRNISNMPYYENAGSGLSGALETVTRIASNIATFFRNLLSSEEEKEEYVPIVNPIGGYTPNEDVKLLLPDAIQGATNKYVDYSGMVGQRGLTAITQLLYDDKEKLVGMTERNTDSDNLVAEIVLTTAIRDGESKSDSGEAGLIIDKLAPAQNTILGEYLAEG